MKTITTSVGFQDSLGVVVANGFLSLTLSQNVIITAGGGQVAASTTILPLDSNGKITATQIWFNDELTPTGTVYHAVLLGSNGLRVITDFGNWSIVGVSADLSTMVPTSGGPSFPNAVLQNPSSSQTITGQSLTLASSAPLIAQGNVTAVLGQNQFKAYNFNTVIWVDGIKYTTVMGAYADLPSTGGVVMVPPNYSETVAADWTLNKKYSAIIFTGPASMSFGSHVITTTAGTHGTAIVSWIPWGSFVTSDPTGVEFKYTGNAAFDTIGDSSAGTFGFIRSNLCYYLNNAGSAAVALKAVRCPLGLIERPVIIGPGGSITQQGIILDGTGDFTGVEIRQPRITGVLKGIQFTGSGVNAANACQVYGGQITAPASGTSLGLDFQAGSSGNVVLGTDVESHAIGLNMASTSQGNRITFRSESNTSGATLASTTTDNVVDIMNSTDPIANAGQNTVYGSANRNLLNYQTVTSVLTGDSTDKTVYTYTLPAGILGQGRGVRITISWLHSSGTASVTYKVFFGSSTSALNVASTSTSASKAVVVVMNDPTSITAQRISSEAFAGTSILQVNAGNSASETTSSSVVIKFTFNVANTDQVIGGQFLVEKIQ